MKFLLVATLGLGPLVLGPSAQSQEPSRAAPARPEPDVIVFLNGDQLTGKLERAVGGNVVFASDMAGELTISFDKIKELRSGAQFALLKKGQPITPKTILPIGTVTLADKQVQLTPLETPGHPALKEDAANVAYLIDKAAFEKQMLHKASFRDGWSGTLSGGATIVRSTTTGTTLTAGIGLLRAIPTVPWLPARNRTILNVTESYGKLSTAVIPPTVPPTPDAVVITSIFHADAERDEYFTPRLYALADTAFDHNYSQGLTLQQVFGGGLGWTPIQTPKQQLDLKADVHYEKQQFQTASANLNIIGSTFFEGYRRNLPRKLLFTQTANVLPAWNQTQAYSANLTAALAIPVFRRLSASVSTTDNYLNDPSPGYQKNSYQFVTGVVYSLR